MLRFTLAASADRGPERQCLETIAPTRMPIVPHSARLELWGCNSFSIPCDFREHSVRRPKHHQRNDERPDSSSSPVPNWLSSSADPSHDFFRPTAGGAGCRCRRTECTAFREHRARPREQEADELHVAIPRLAKKAAITALVPCPSPAIAPHRREISMARTQALNRRLLDGVVGRRRLGMPLHGDHPASGELEASFTPSVRARRGASPSARGPRRPDGGVIERATVTPRASASRVPDSLVTS